MSEQTRDIQVRETEKREVAPSGAERTRDRLTFVPRVDIYENGDEIVVVADMPGVDEKSLDVTLEHNVLTINGCVEPMNPEKRNLAYAEYRVGDYERSFSLSDQIDRDKIEATVRNGVLRLHLPKITAARTRKIAVRGG